MTTPCESVLDLLLKEAAKQKEKSQVTEVTQVAEDISTRILKENNVTPDDRIGVSPGLHHLESRGMFASIADLCVGKLCSYLRQGDGFICGVNGQTIATLFSETGRCPENRWRRLQLPATTHKCSTHCSICGRNRWWRPFGQNRNICSVCHPPALAENEYQDLTTKES